MIINLTPHAITLRHAPYDYDTVIGPSGSVARVSSVPGSMRTESIIPIYGSPTWGEVIGLPEPAEGVIYIVSALVAARVPEREDVVSPGTGPNDGAVRDAAGHILAVTRLISAKSF